MRPGALADFVILAVLDGWGIAPPGPGNAILQAKTFNMNRFWASFPHTQLAAAGESVGLPRGEAGNTETGHLNLGAGRIVYQDLARINMAIADGTFFKNQALLGAIEHAKKNNSNLHLMGLIGAGGVHSNLEHLYALLKLAKEQNFTRVYLHLFTDGRDSPTTAAKVYLEQLRKVIETERIGVIASLMGRYWAMDRDMRWERTKKAYFALTKGEGQLVKTTEEVLEMSYMQAKTDEFIEPSLLTDSAGKPVAIIKDNDAVIFFNFRIDRPRQLSRAFLLKDFSKAGLRVDFDPYAVKYEKKHVLERPAPVKEPFERGAPLANLYFVMMTEYGRPLIEAGAKAAFPPEVVTSPLGSVISEANLRQLRVTESEKERFVTYYFNGQQEVSFHGEERLIIPSPKVPTYDQKPEMSAREVTTSLIARLQDSKEYAFILVNYANPDMVGHTGNIGSVVTACEAVDECLGKLADFVFAYNGLLVITADHGNAEEMINAKTGQISTEHSANPVPFVIVGKNFIGKPISLTEGILADVAPTVLSFLGITPPSSMTGRSLIDLKL